VVHLGASREELEREFAAVELAGEVPPTYGMAYLNGLPIWICHGLRMPLAEMWPQARDFH
jgi:hypothetical protein